MLASGRPLFVLTCERFDSSDDEPQSASVETDLSHSRESRSEIVVSGHGSVTRSFFQTIHSRYSDLTDEDRLGREALSTDIMSQLSPTAAAGRPTTASTDVTSRPRSGWTIPTAARVTHQPVRAHSDLLASNSRRGGGLLLLSAREDDRNRLYQLIRRIEEACDVVVLKGRGTGRPLEIACHGHYGFEGERNPMHRGGM